LSLTNRGVGYYMGTSLDCRQCMQLMYAALIIMQCVTVTSHTEIPRFRIGSSLSGLDLLSSVFLLPRKATCIVVI